MSDRYMVKLVTALVYAIAIVWGAHELSKMRGLVEVQQEFASNMLKNTQFDIEDASTGVMISEDGISTPRAARELDTDTRPNVFWGEKP